MECYFWNLGFHQKCHTPPIPPSALELNSPWHCIYCVRHVKNPYLTESIDVMQSLFEVDDDEESVRPFNHVKVKIEKDVERLSTSEASCAITHAPLSQVSPPQKKRKV